MIGKTIRQIFKAVNDYNNIIEVIHSGEKEKTLVIYVDDMKFYEGTSYVKFFDLLNEEYIPEYSARLLNSLFAGSETSTFIVDNGEYKVEVYIQ